MGLAATALQTVAAERMTLVFIPGAMHSAWAWNKIVPLVEAQGVIALSPDLPGIGRNRSVSPEDATLHIWGDYIADIVRSAQPPVVLVGHSRGGAVIGEVAERVPELIAGLIYVCGLIVPPGRTAVEILGRGDPEVEGALPTQDGKAFHIRPQAAISLFYHRCSPEDAAAAVDHLCLEPAAPNITPATVTQERWFRVPRAYVETSDDRTLSLAKQREIQAAAPCDPVISIDADHSPFLSAAPDLAEAILKIAFGFVASR